MGDVQGALQSVTSVRIPVVNKSVRECAGRSPAAACAGRGVLWELHSCLVPLRWWLPHHVAAAAAAAAGPCSVVLFAGPLPHQHRRCNTPCRPLPPAVDFLPGGISDKVNAVLGPGVGQAVDGLNKGAAIIDGQVVPIINDTVLPVSEWVGPGRTAGRACGPGAAGCDALGAQSAAQRAGQRGAGGPPTAAGRRPRPASRLAPPLAADHQRRVRAAGVDPEPAGHVALRHHRWWAGGCCEGLALVRRALEGGGAERRGVQPAGRAAHQPS